MYVKSYNSGQVFKYLIMDNLVVNITDFNLIQLRSDSKFQYRSYARYKARVIYTCLHEEANTLYIEANTCLYIHVHS